MRDEKSLKNFILKDYNDFSSAEVPTELPTFTENIMEALSEMYQFIMQIYNSDNTTAKIILSFLFGIIFVLFSAVFYFGCIYTEKPGVSHRNSKARESTSSERASLSNNDSRNSTPKLNNEGVKRRSTTRRRD